MPEIDNTANIPQVNEGAQTLRVISSKLVEGTTFEDPTVPETKLEVMFEVETPGEDRTRFSQQLSLNLGDKATLGNIYRACMRTKDVARGSVNSDDMHGKIFDCMVGHSSGGWPKVVNGSAYPSRQGGAGQMPVVEPRPWEPDGEVYPEAPF